MPAATFHDSNHGVGVVVLWGLGRKVPSSIPQQSRTDHESGEVDLGPRLPDKRPNVLLDSTCRPRPLLSINVVYYPFHRTIR